MNSVSLNSFSVSSYLAVVIAFHDGFALFLSSFSTYVNAYWTAVIYWIKLLFET